MTLVDDKQHGWPRCIAAGLTVEIRENGRYGYRAMIGADEVEKLLEAMQKIEKPRYCKYCSEPVPIEND